MKIPASKTSLVGEAFIVLVRATYKSSKLPALASFGQTFQSLQPIVGRTDPAPPPSPRWAGDQARATKLFKISATALTPLHLAFLCSRTRNCRAPAHHEHFPSTPLNLDGVFSITPSWRPSYSQNTERPCKLTTPPRQRANKSNASNALAFAKTSAKSFSEAPSLCSGASSTTSKARICHLLAQVHSRLASIQNS